MTTAAAHQYQQLHRYFNRVVEHYKLSPEARKMAWVAATSAPIHATECYRQIAYSLRVVKP